MIATYAMLQPQLAPQGSKEWLETQLTNADVTGFTVTLMSVTTNGYLFSVSADETDDNATTLTAMFGTINTIVPGQEQPQAQARGEVFRVGGSWDGRFARENPPPGNARK